jgi:cell wall-associated NlpC family hydrolase
MRKLGPAAVLSLGLVAGCLVTSAQADPRQPIPSKQDVANAQQAVTSKQGQVRQIRQQLAAANAKLQQASDAAEIAAEAYNGARYEAQQARKAATAAQQAADQAAAAQAQQRKAYAQGVVGNYQSAPELTTLAGIAKAHGIDEIQQQTSAMSESQKALNAQYGRVQAAASLATVTAQQATAAQDKAVKAESAAKTKRDAAVAAANAAQAEAESVAVQKKKLLKQLARLKHVSVAIATQRQQALEERAQERAAEKAAAEAAAKAAAEAAAQQAAQQAAAKAAQQAAAKGAKTGTLGSPGGPTPSAPTTHAPAATSAGVAAALAFARAQIGEPYVWGAAGPNSWDCSGLTMKAWQQGGIDLPHYSVAQYEQSTPISLGDLQPGDLVFWGTTDSPSSIHHVALYAGDGMIIQAPHTGADVDEVSMYSWEAPNFFARP